MIGTHYLHIAGLYCLLMCLPLYIDAQRVVIDDLTVDFDGSENVNIVAATDSDGNPGFFGVRNGAFEIRDIEGNECPNVPVDGLNDNIAIVIGGFALNNYCDVSVTIEIRISDGDFEDCLTPGSLQPIGCTDFGIGEPGADAMVVSVELGGVSITAGYCGDMPEGIFNQTGIDVDIGDVILLTIIGGTQADDEAYFIDRILVEGRVKGVVPALIAGDDRHCANEGAIVLNLIAQGATDISWTKDGVDLNNDNDPLFFTALPTSADGGLYRADFLGPTGCPDFAELMVVVEDCFIPDPVFTLPQEYCSDESLNLSNTSDNGIAGNWDVDINQLLEELEGDLIVTFRPNNGGVNFVDTLQVNPVFIDTLRVPLCPQNPFTINGNNYTLADTSLLGLESFTSTAGCDSLIYVQILPMFGDITTIDGRYCADDTIMINNQLYHIDRNMGQDSFTNVMGCDSIVTINLVFEDPTPIDILGLFCPDDIELIGGEAFDRSRPSGTVVVPSAMGCDSVLQVNLTFIESDSMTIEVPLCPGEATNIRDIDIDRNFDPDLYFSFGPNGCDTIINFVVLPLEPVNNAIENELCHEGAVIINGNTYNRSNATGMELFTASNGCDSIVTIDLNFKSVDSTYLNEEYCENINFMTTINNTVYDQSNPQGAETLMGSDGCDSVVIIDFSFIQDVASAELHDGCAGDGYNIVVGATTYDENNPTGTQVLRTEDGCDSTVTINLSYKPLSMFRLMRTICDADFILVEGEFFDANRPSGVVSTVGFNGCDSIIEVNLDFYETDSMTIEVPLCPDETQTILGIEVDRDFSSDLYFSFGPNGCDSIINFAVIDIEPVAFLLEDEICLNEVRMINGTSYNAANLIGQEVFTASNGCDSIVEVNLSVMPKDTSYLIGVYCADQGINFDINGEIYDQDNPQGSETLLNNIGCDSVVIVDLSFLNNVSGQETYNGCQDDGYSVQVNNVLYDQSNPVGTEVLLSADGCDSIVSISLIYNELRSGIESIRACAGDGYSVLVGSNVYDESNPVGTEILTSSTGCDSTVDISLEYLEPVVTDIFRTGCMGDGYNVEVNGMVYDESLSFGMETLTAASGCDSIVMIDLLYSEPDTTMLNDDLCERDGSSRSINGTIYDQSNPSGVEVLIGVNGCDSVIVIDFNFTETVVNDLIRTICPGESIVVDGVTYDASNPAGMERIVQANGCDSIINIDLDFYGLQDFTFTLDTVISGSSYQIQLVETDQIDRIQWNSDGLDCTDCTDPILTTDNNTTLNASITDINGCDYLIAIPVVIDDNNALFNIYIPNVMNLNSVSGNDRIMPILPDGVQGTYDIDIYDRWGGVMFQSQDVSINNINGGWNGLVNGESVSPGVYPYKMTVYVDSQEPIIRTGAITVF